MKNVKKKSSVKMCWLWGKRALYLPQGRGDPLICVPQRSRIINGVAVGGDGSLRHPIKQSLTL